MRKLEVIYFENPHTKAIAFSTDYGATIIIPNGRGMPSEGTVWVEVLGDYDEELTEIQKKILDERNYEYEREKPLIEQMSDDLRLGRLRQAWENKPVPRK